MNPNDILINFYKDQEFKQKKEKPFIYPLGLSTNSLGLGDIISVSSIFKTAARQNKKVALQVNQNPYWQLIKEYIPNYNHPLYSTYQQTEDLSNFDLGNGNLAQRFARLLGLEPDLMGTGSIEIKSQKVPNRVCYSFKTGNSCQYISHPRNLARQLYPENRVIFNEFIQENPQYEFYDLDEMGKILTLEHIMHIIATCQYFFGLNSGLMHVAGSLGLKSIIILTTPQNVYLPVLKPIEMPDIEWLLAANVHLHQDRENPLVPLFSKNNLLKSLNGEVYPYWKEEHLPLIFHKF